MTADMWDDPLMRAAAFAGGLENGAYPAHERIELGRAACNLYSQCIEALESQRDEVLAILDDDTVLNNGTVAMAARIRTILTPTKEN